MRHRVVMLFAEKDGVIYAHCLYDVIERSRVSLPVIDTVHRISERGLSVSRHHHENSGKQRNSKFLHRRDLYAGRFWI